MNIGKLPVGAPDILDSAGWSRRRARWNISAMIGKLGRKIHVADVQILPVDELCEVVANEFLGFCVRHGGLRIHGFLRGALVLMLVSPYAPAAWPRKRSLNSFRY
jgi:hypothetical protein